MYWDAGIERTGMHDTLDGVGREGSAVYAGASSSATRNVNASHHADARRACLPSAPLAEADAIAAPHPCA